MGTPDSPDSTGAHALGGTPAPVDAASTPAGNGATADPITLVPLGKAPFLPAASTEPSEKNPADHEPSSAVTSPMVGTKSEVAAQIAALLAAAKAPVEAEPPQASMADIPMGPPAGSDATEANPSWQPPEDLPPLIVMSQSVSDAAEDKTVGPFSSAGTLSAEDDTVGPFSVVSSRGEEDKLLGDVLPSGIDLKRDVEADALTIPSPHMFDSIEGNARLVPSVSDPTDSHPFVMGPAITPDAIDHRPALERPLIMRSASDMEGGPTIVSDERYCPICDRDVGAEYCPEHGVCTIRVGVTSGEPPSVGKVVAGRYGLEQLIGKGGMGAVYRATQLGVRREVAVKVLLPDLTAERRVVKRFYREAFAVSQMSHPNVVRLVDFGVDPASNSPFMVLDLVSGKTLRAFYESNGTLPERRCAALMAQVAKGLIDAHAKNLIHRDLKPDNLMVESLSGGDEHIRILDFGLTRMLDESATAGRITESGTVIGTPLYMSPEQATGAPISTPTDLYSLGCIMYELLAGAPPFTGMSTLAVLTKHVYEPAPPLPERLADGAPPSPGLVAIMKQLLEKEPSKRPATASEVAKALSALAVAPVSSPAPPLPPVAQPPPPPRARTGYLLVGTAVFAVGATLWISRGPTDDPEARARPSPSASAAVDTSTVTVSPDGGVH